MHFRDDAFLLLDQASNQLHKPRAGVFEEYAYAGNTSRQRQQSALRKHSLISQVLLAYGNREKKLHLAEYSSTDYAGSEALKCWKWLHSLYSQRAHWQHHSKDL